MEMSKQNVSEKRGLGSYKIFAKNELKLCKKKSCFYDLSSEKQSVRSFN